MLTISNKQPISRQFVRTPLYNILCKRLRISCFLPACVSRNLRMSAKYAHQSKRWLHLTHEDLLSHSRGVERRVDEREGAHDEPTRDVRGGGGKMSRLLEISARRSLALLPRYLMMVRNTGFVKLNVTHVN